MSRDDESITWQHCDIILDGLNGHWSSSYDWFLFFPKTREEVFYLFWKTTAEQMNRFPLKSRGPKRRNRANMSECVCVCVCETESERWEGGREGKRE